MYNKILDNWTFGGPRDPGGPPSTSDINVSRMMRPDMWPQDTVIVLSGQGVRVGLSSVRLTVIWGPHKLFFGGLSGTCGGLEHVDRRSCGVRVSA